MAQDDSGSGGSDGSGSGSNSATLGSRAGEGAFRVGGGLQIPSLAWAALLAVGALLLFGWLRKKRRK